MHSLEEMLAKDAAVREREGNVGGMALGHAGKELFTRGVSNELPDFGSEASSEADLLEWDDLNTPKGAPTGGVFSEISLDDKPADLLSF